MIKKIYNMWICLIKKMGYIDGTYLFIEKIFNRKKYNELIIKILSNEMKNLINKYKNINESIKVKESKFKGKNPIWVFWYQGYENMPNIVKASYNSIIKNMENENTKVYLLSKENINKYCEIPQYIIDKFLAGKITITHFSDILRSQLLSTYGGCWIDSTCFVKDKVESSIWKYDFYTQKCKKNTMKFFTDGKWSAYFLMGKPGSIIFKYLNEFFYEYWKNNNYLIDYYLIDYALTIAYREIPLIKELIEKVPENNTEVMTICENWNRYIDEINIEEKISDNWFLKLTWKENVQKNSKKQTVSEWFYNNYVINYLD